MESWHVHELMLGVIATLIAGFIFAHRRMSAVSAKVAELEKENEHAQKPVSVSNDRTHFVVKCVSCSRYQVHDDHLFTANV